jgi:repressor of nif and glnA expression
MSLSPSLSTSFSLENIKQKIDTLEEKHHLHIGSILRKNAQIKLNSNKNGILVNLSTIPSETIDEVMKYLNYVSDQEYSISQMESTAEELKQFISEKDHKDNYSILPNQ